MYQNPFGGGGDTQTFAPDRISESGRTKLMKTFYSKCLSTLLIKFTCRVLV